MGYGSIIIVSFVKTTVHFLWDFARFGRERIGFYVSVLKRGLCMSAVMEKGQRTRRQQQPLQQITEFTLDEAARLVPNGSELEVDDQTVGCACTNCGHARSDNAITNVQRVKLVKAGERTLLIHAGCPIQTGMHHLQPVRRDLLQILAEVKGIRIV